MSDSVFDDTPWSAVLGTRNADPERARRAFERLCAAYSPAITHWMRLQGLSHHDAEDASQDFLTRWLQRENPLQSYQQQDHRFRQFLRVCLHNFLKDRAARAVAKKRGDGAPHTPWEHDEQISDGADAHAQIDYTVAAQIHADTLAQLKSQWQGTLADGHFDRLQAVALGTAENPGYAALAKELGLTVIALKNRIPRFRSAYHEAFRKAVSLQADLAEVDGDLIYLHQLLLRPPR